MIASGNLYNISRLIKIDNSKFKCLRLRKSRESMLINISRFKYFSKFKINIAANVPIFFVCIITIQKNLFYGSPLVLSFFSLKAWSMSFNLQFITFSIKTIIDFESSKTITSSSRGVTRKFRTF